MNLRCSHITGRGDMKMLQWGPLIGDSLIEPEQAIQQKKDIIFKDRASGDIAITRRMFPSKSTDPLLLGIC